ncbi:MAG: alpha/beta fold hydrolase [Acidobacteriota bacterium]
MIGKTLAHYEILEKIGEGGMGEVYRARDMQLDRDVAVKLLPDTWSSDSLRLRRFEREAKVLASLEHPNIAAVYGFHEDNGVHFIAMELVEGETLASSITDGGLPLDRLLEIGIPFIEAIVFAHKKGVIHRDLKPTNIMLDPSGRIRILDFGLAVLLQEESDPDGEDMTVDALTTDGEVVGTVAYMAPEQLEGRSVDSRADLFSIGVVLYELATGKRPFRGNSTAGVASAVLRDDPLSVREVRPDLPADLARVVRRCLEKNADRRIQTATDIRNELEDLREGHRTDEPVPSIGIPGTSRSLAEHHMVITTEHVRRLSTQIPRMVGDSMTYLDNQNDSDVLVIYLHGIGGDQRLYEDVLRETPWRAIAPSLYGFGQSARIRPPLPLTDHNLLVTFLMEEVIRRVRPRRVVLAGHSSGSDQALQIVGSAEGVRIHFDGLILLGPGVMPGPGFVSGPYSKLTDDPSDILEAIRTVSAAAKDLDTWLKFHDYLVHAFGKFGTDIEVLRKFAQTLITAYDDDQFFELFRAATERVPQIRCVFSTDEHNDADHVLKRHIGANALGNRFSEEMIVSERVGHTQLIDAAVLLPYVEEIVRVSAE